MQICRLMGLYISSVFTVFSQSWIPNPRSSQSRLTNRLKDHGMVGFGTQSCISDIISPAGHCGQLPGRSEYTECLLTKCMHSTLPGCPVGRCLHLEANMPGGRSASRALG